MTSSQMFGRRLTPAYAGSTRNIIARGVAGWAHPRLRGEHVADEFLQALPGGSSPLTRGALGSLLGHSGLRGLIPAYAGSTVSPPTASQWWRSHPRLRGEHNHIRQAVADDGGSSPLTRGAQKPM